MATETTVTLPPKLATATTTQEVKDYLDAKVKADMATTRMLDLAKKDPAKYAEEIGRIINERNESETSLNKAVRTNAKTSRDVEATRTAESEEARTDWADSITAHVQEFVDDNLETLAQIPAKFHTFVCVYRPPGSATPKVTVGVSPEFRKDLVEGSATSRRGGGRKSKWEKIIVTLDDGTVKEFASIADARAVFTRKSDRTKQFSKDYFTKTCTQEYDYTVQFVERADSDGSDNEEGDDES